MDIQSIVGSLIGLAQDNPSILGSLVEHPYSTVRTVSGVQDVSRTEAAEVVTAVSSLAQGQAVDFGTLGNLAQLLLGQNDNSVHTLAGSLFGNLLSQAEVVEEEPPAQEVQAAGMNLDLGKLAMIAGSLLAIANATGVTGKKTKQSGVDLSDGVGLDDLAGLAATLMANGQAPANKRSKKTAAKPAIDLSDGIGLDDMIGIAGSLLGGK
ncbi:MAG: hypothetical protein IJG82_00110 [Atopobiaceae bacterium]|nr:hypothetical protein [Atopobiaceae bacterium]